MKKWILILLLISVNQFSLTSQNVSVQDVKQVAASVISERFPSADFVLADIICDSFNEMPVFYIQRLQPTGYIIVAASRSVMPLLAYSFDSYYDDHRNCSSFNSWMHTYALQINQANATKAEINPAVDAAWDRYLRGDIQPSRPVMTPLLTSSWNQDTYYNELCPIDAAGPDDHCYAGCVATAIGQLMNYFRWPLQGTGSYTSTDLVYGTLSVDYGNSYYNWNEMPLNLGRSNFEVAQLLYHIGVSVDMHYSPNGSGMNNHKAAYTMRTFFGYVDSTEYYFRDSISLDWDSVLISHLDRNLPLYYAGWSDTIYEMGHAFVCDAYQDTAYFHFNWGWDGAYDGYFFIDNLMPGGSDFTLLHEAVVNMQPDGAYPYYCSGLLDTLTSLDGTIDDGSGPLYNYAPNANCSWLIAPNDSVSKITLSFVRLNTESATDIIRIYNGDNVSAPVVGTYSGSTIPSVLNVNGKKVLVTFQSDNVNESSGFLLSWSATVVPYCSNMLTLTAESDTINDGSAQFAYHNSTFCRWKIEPSSGLPVVLDFLDFDIDSTDYVRVTDHTSSVLLGEFRGNDLPSSLYSANGTMTVLFLAGSTATADGFSFSYHTSLAGQDEAIATVCKIYPNPTAGSIRIENAPSCNLRIMGIDGRMVYEGVLVGQDQYIDVSTLLNGIYILHLSNDSFSEILRFVKQ